MSMTIKDWRCLLLSGLVGAIAPLAFSPFNYWPVMLVSIALFFWLLNNQPIATAAGRGFAYGLGLFGTGVSWVYVSIHQFGSAPIPLAILLTVLFVALLAAVFFAPIAALFSHFSRDRSSWQKVLLFSGLWILGEWLRSWFLTGFPWLYAGYTLLDTPFAGLSPVTGVYGLSLLLALTGATAASLLAERTKAQFALVGLTIALGVTAVLLDGRQWTEKTDIEPISFAAVQGNISQDLKWEPGHLDNTIQSYLSLTASQWQKDLVFWPENAIPTFYQSVEGLMGQLKQHADQTNTALIIGMPWYTDNDTYYNALIGMGEAGGTYFKQKLVPFGEFVPFEELIRGLIAFFNLPMSSFSAGDSGQAGLTIKNQSVASYICYEVVYPDFAVAQAKDKGLLLTVSNDTWFGKSIGPAQHFQMVRMRSLETGRYQLRVTNDGITALIDSMGNVISTIPRYTEGVLEGEIPVMRGDTPFMRFGSWPVLLLSVLLTLAAAVFFRDKRSEISG